MGKYREGESGMSVEFSAQRHDEIVELLKELRTDVALSRVAKAVIERVIILLTEEEDEENDD